jgi:hypothetical protein
MFLLTGDLHNSIEIVGQYWAFVSHIPTFEFG